MNSDFSGFVDESVVPPIISLANAPKLIAILLQSIFIAPLLFTIPLVLSCKLFGVNSRPTDWRVSVAFSVVIIIYWNIAHHLELWKYKNSPEKSGNSLAEGNTCEMKLADMTAAGVWANYFVAFSQKFFPQFKSFYLISALHQYFFIHLILLLVILMLLISTWILFVFELQVNGAISPRIIQLLSRILIHMSLLPLLPYLFQLFIV